MNCSPFSSSPSGLANLRLSLSAPNPKLKTKKPKEKKRKEKEGAKPRNSKMMSLVEYDSSDSDEEATEINPTEQAPPSATSQPETAATPSLPQPNENPVLTSSDTVAVPSSSTAPTRSSNTVPASSLPSLDELPDAEFLFSSPQNESRKRESSGNGVIPSRQKFPRGGTQSSVAHVRNIRAPTAGTLVPPQLTGRSNVVTEDVNKLFVNRRRSSGGL